MGSTLPLLLLRLDLTPHLSDRVLDVALSRGECILDRHRDMLVLWRVAVSLGDNDVLVARHGDADIDLDQSTFLMPRLRRNNCYVTAS